MRGKEGVGGRWAKEQGGKGYGMRWKDLNMKNKKGTWVTE